MTGLKINIPDELDKRFRETAMKKFGYTRGALSIAAEKALDEWTSRTERAEKAKSIAKRHVKNPLDEMEGLLAHVKDKTSVELQHEAGKYRAEMAMRYKKG